MSKITEKIKTFAGERGWGNQMPADVSKSVSIESAELLEHFQWTNPTAEEIKKDTQELESIGSEIADVLIYCYHLTNILGLDPDKIVDEKLEYAAKKYPPHAVKTEKERRKIQKEWRVKEKNS